jgi:hypothetical protein
MDEREKGKNKNIVCNNPLKNNIHALSLEKEDVAGNPITHWTIIFNH